MRVRRSWIWIAWAVGAIVIVWGSWALLESAALSDPDGLTLSQFMVNVARAWPPIVLLIGIVIGVFIGTLNTHVFWPWVPKHLRATCGQCGKTILLTGEPK